MCRPKKEKSWKNEPQKGMKIIVFLRNNKSYNSQRNCAKKQNNLNLFKISGQDEFNLKKLFERNAVFSGENLS